MKFWGTVYIFPDKFKVDQRSVFPSHHLRVTWNMVYIKTIITWIRILKLPWIFKLILRVTVPYNSSIGPRASWQIIHTLPAICYTSVEQQIIASIIYSTIPRFSAVITSLAREACRIRALVGATSEIVTLTCKLRTEMVLQPNFQATKKYHFIFWQYFFVYRENEQAMWTSPFKIARVESKQAFFGLNWYIAQKSNSALLSYNRYLTDL